MSTQTLSDAARLLKGGHPIAPFLAMLDDTTRAALVAELVGPEETWWCGQAARGFLVPAWACLLRKNVVREMERDHSMTWDELRARGNRVVKVLVRRAP